MPIRRPSTIDMYYTTARLPHHLRTLPVLVSWEALLEVKAAVVPQAARNPVLEAADLSASLLPSLE
jgi:hypothetical protein